MIQESPDLRVGDWVRFYRNGTLVIAVVNYMRERSRYPRGKEALTDHGPIAPEDVVEVRRAD